MANRLATAASAYLRSAAHQPIDWYEFGEEAFEAARVQDKPVLLDIGAVWCHWCHVIDRESYDDPEIAALINERYIAVKVDRDERPDVDMRYQQVVQSLTGQGGWPLTGFLTHDGRAIYGGTYYPPAQMKNLLLKISDMYVEKKDQIFADDAMLDAKDIDQVKPLAEDSPTLDNAFVNLSLASAKKMMDTSYGGFGTQPKFPHFSTLGFLMHRYVLQPDDDVLSMIDKTLTQMAKGGIYDQVAGGIHRYSVDRIWHVPHFEKMAYDNAEGIGVYTQAYQLTGNEFYKTIANDMIDWVNRDLSDQANGGFYASQDADIDLEDDGDHFTWSLEEAKAILTNEEFELVVVYYGLTDRGDMHPDSPHGRIGRNVLMVQRDLADDYESQLLQSVKQKMLAQRAKRPTPYIDTTLYTNWNMMFVLAYLDASIGLNRLECKTFALKTLDLMIETRWCDNAGFKHTNDGPAFLEDNAWGLAALLKAYQVTANQSYLNRAKALADLLMSEFEDKVQGGFFDTMNRDGAMGLLKFPRKPIEDNPSSSANAMALKSFLTLFYLTGDDKCQNVVSRSLKGFYHARNHGIYASALSELVDLMNHPPLKLEICGELALSEDWKKSVLEVFYPNKVILYQPELTESVVKICLGHHCLQPVNDREGFKSAIQKISDERIVLSNLKEPVS